MGGTESEGGSRAVRGGAAAPPPSLLLNPPAHLPSTIHHSNDQSVGVHRINVHPVSIHRTDVQRTNGQHAGVQSVNVHRSNNIQTVNTGHATRRLPVISGSDVQPSSAQHTSGRESSEGQEVGYPVVKAGRDVWSCEEEVGQHRDHTHNTKFRKTVYRRMLRVAQRVPRPLYLAVICCKEALPTLLASHRNKAVLLSSVLMMCIMLLSIPNVPERFLGIRSPERVLESFNLPQNDSNKESEGSIHVMESKQHSLQKRHVPHKFWARARPHNKFLRKRKHPKHQPYQPQQVMDVNPPED